MIFLSWYTFLCLFARFAALHSRKDITFISLVEDHRSFPRTYVRTYYSFKFVDFISRGLGNNYTFFLCNSKFVDSHLQKRIYFPAEKFTDIKRPDNTKQKKNKNIYYVQTTTQKATDCTTRIPLKPEWTLVLWTDNSLCSTSDTRRVTVKRQEHHMIGKSCWTPVYLNKYNKDK